MCHNSRRRLALAVSLFSLTFQAANAAIMPTDLVGYYPFDGNGNDLGSNNVPVSIVNISSASSTFSGTGKFSQAFGTDADGGAFPAPGGTSDVAQDLTDSASPKLVGSTAYTLTGWFKFNNIGLDTETQNAHLINTDRGGANPGYRVSMQAGLAGQDRAFDFSSNGGGASINLTSLGNPWLENTWYFFAARMNGPGDSVVWLVPETSNWASRMGAAGSGTAPGGTSAALQFGRDTPNGAFDGLKDDFSIWNRALTTAEVEEIFTAGLQGNPLGAILVPEPASGLLLLLGAIGLVRLSARRFTNNSEVK